MDSEQETTSWICVAAIATAHGVRGALKLRCFTEDPRDVAAYGPLFDRQGRRLFDIEIIGSAKDGVIAKATGINDREAAEALRGTELFVPRTALPEPEDGEFYYQDLQGLVVVNATAERIGIVKQVVNYGAGDLLEIASDTGETIIMPFDQETVPAVDLAKGQITVIPPNEIVVEPEA